MGKKRQRSSAAEAQNETSTKAVVSSIPPEQPHKKHKKAPLQLKVISFKGSAAPLVKPKEIATEVVNRVANVSSSDEPQAVKKKKKSKNKKKHGSSGADSSAKIDSNAKKASTEDIDDLFQSLKTKKQQSVQAAEQQKLEEARERKKQRKEREQLDEKIKKLESQNTNFTAVQGKNPDPRPVRYDADGLPIYKEEHLMINQGGDTADCPFDCWCCF